MSCGAGAILILALSYLVANRPDDQKSPAARRGTSMENSGGSGIETALGDHSQFLSDTVEGSFRDEACGLVPTDALSTYFQDSDPFDFELSAETYGCIDNGEGVLLGVDTTLTDHQTLATVQDPNRTNNLDPSEIAELTRLAERDIADPQSACRRRVEEGGDLILHTPSWGSTVVQGASPESPSTYASIGRVEPSQAEGFEILYGRPGPYIGVISIWRPGVCVSLRVVFSTPEEPSLADLNPLVDELAGFVEVYIR